MRAHAAYNLTAVVVSPIDGPFWQRMLAATVLAGLIMGSGVLMLAARIERDTARSKCETAPIIAESAAYGTKDPYGFGPRAFAGPGTPGGAADQESELRC